MMCRDPKGHFLDRGGMMTAWLPLMLSWVYSENGLIQMLSLGKKYCEQQAANCLSRNATSIKQYPPEGNNPIDFWGVKQAEKWAARRMVLAEAITKLIEIK